MNRLLGPGSGGLLKSRWMHGSGGWGGNFGFLGGDELLGLWGRMLEIYLR